MMVEICTSSFFVIKNLIHCLDFIPTKKVDCKPAPPPPHSKPEPVSESSTSSHDTKCSDVEEQNENSSPESSHDDTEEESSSIHLEKPVIPPVTTSKISIIIYH